MDKFKNMILAITAVFTIAFGAIGIGLAKDVGTVEAASACNSWLFNNGYQKGATGGCAGRPGGMWSLRVTCSSGYAGATIVGGSGRTGSVYCDPGAYVTSHFARWIS